MKDNPLNYKISDFNLLEPQKGRVLISEPFMADPYFKRSVVLLIEHNDEGSFGFILNKSFEFRVCDTLKDFPEFDMSVYMGGPVQPDHLFFVHTLGNEIEESIEIFDGLYWAGDFEAVKEAIKLGKISEQEIRFFLGYAGWDADQLSQEIKEDSWIISNASANNIMEVNAEELWREMMIGMGEQCSPLANFPEDPSYN